MISTDPMEVTIALEARYAVAPDGSVWSQAGMARGFWERYLEVFDTVRIVARGTPVERVPEDWLVVNSDNILFLRVPDFHGPWQCLKRYPAIRAAVRAATPAHGAVILRVGSQIANILEPQLHERKYPYALEVIGDPSEVFAPGVVDHPLRPFFRWHFSPPLAPAVPSRQRSGLCYETNITGKVPRPVRQREHLRRGPAGRGSPGPCLLDTLFEHRIRVGTHGRMHSQSENARALSTCNSGFAGTALQRYGCVDRSDGASGAGRIRSTGSHWRRGKISTGSHSTFRASRYGLPHSVSRPSHGWGTGTARPGYGGSVRPAFPYGRLAAGTDRGDGARDSLHWIGGGRHPRVAGCERTGACGRS